MAKAQIEFQKFTNEELLSLQLFHDRVSQMNESRIIKEKSLGCQITLNIDRTIGLSLEKRFPDEDDLRSFLLIIRPFTLNNEPINYHRILSILRENIIEEKCRRCLHECLRSFNEQITHNGINLQINSICAIGDNIKIDTTEYEMESIFNLLLNGYYAHQDISKVKELECLKDEYFMNAGEAVAKEMFIGMLIEYFSFFNFLDYYIISNIIERAPD
jgi:hypothetical protein